MNHCNNSKESNEEIDISRKRFNSGAVRGSIFSEQLPSFLLKIFVFSEESLLEEHRLV